MAKGTLKDGNCCEDCKYLHLIPLVACECWEPSNLNHYYNWLGKWQKPIRDPKKRNRNNDCYDFQPKKK